MKTIYLCGPIKDASEAEANEWRDTATKSLEPSFKILNPMRRQFKDGDQFSVNEIVQFDLEDVKEADILLVNFCKARPETTFCGTSMEMREAYLQGKFIVTYTNLPLTALSPWVQYHSTRIVHSVYDAIDYIRKQFDDEN